MDIVLAPVTAVGTTLQRMDGRGTRNAGMDIAMDTTGPRTDRVDIVPWIDTLPLDISRQEPIGHPSRFGRTSF